MLGVLRGRADGRPLAAVRASVRAGHARVPHGGRASLDAGAGLVAARARRGDRLGRARRAADVGGRRALGGDGGRAARGDRAPRAGGRVAVRDGFAAGLAASPE